VTPHAVFGAALTRPAACCASPWPQRFSRRAMQASCCGAAATPRPWAAPATSTSQVRGLAGVWSRPGCGDPSARPMTLTFTPASSVVPLQVAGRQRRCAARTPATPPPCPRWWSTPPGARGVGGGLDWDSPAAPPVTARTRVSCSNRQAVPTNHPLPRRDVNHFATHTNTHTRTRLPSVTTPAGSAAQPRALRLAARAQVRHGTGDDHHLALP
jgi:hypothetical protein